MKPPSGFLFSGIHSGIKKNNLDLGLIFSYQPAEAVCFFTTNKVKASPILVNLQNLKRNNFRVRAIIVNSGNANCFTGKKGLEDVRVINEKLSELLGVEPEFILSASTGIIGRRLPREKILNNLTHLVSSLKPDFGDFSEAILTTDTRRKISFRKIGKNSSSLRILGIAKGAGMIYPQLKKATMLAFILTDASISRKLLEKACQAGIETSFNSLSVDGCMSTNDSVFVLASGQSGYPRIQKEDRNFYKFSKALSEVMLDLACQIIKDAEGSTKFVEIEVKGAKTKEEARKAAYAIANSNLFKTSLYGEESNWGRIVAALGQAQIPLREDISIRHNPLKARELRFEINLKRGKFSWKVYTSDLTPRYVEINAGYS